MNEEILIYYYVVFKMRIWLKLIRKKIASALTIPNRNQWFYWVLQVTISIRYVAAIIP